MPALRCDGQSVPVEAGESLLEALLKAGVPLPHSCRAGACQSCLVKVTAGVPPTGSQVGLRPALAQQGFVLGCLARPEHDLEISTDAAAAASIRGTIVGVTPLSRDVVLVSISPSEPLSYRAGQFLTVLRDDGLARSYSIASLPGSPYLDFHVRVLPGGQMSQWFASAPVGCDVALRGPNGECFYDPAAVDMPLVLAGTGTGLAPLWAVLHDALRHGHRGPIDLLHGARDPEGLYLVDALEAVAGTHPNVSYSPCVLTGSVERTTVGALDDVVFGRYSNLAGHQVFLCGDPTLVQKMKRRAFLAGARLADIHADAFVTAPKPGVAR